LKVAHCLLQGRAVCTFPQSSDCGLIKAPGTSGNSSCLAPVSLEQRAGLFCFGFIQVNTLIVVVLISNSLLKNLLLTQSPFRNMILSGDDKPKSSPQDARLAANRVFGRGTLAARLASSSTGHPWNYVKEVRNLMSENLTLAALSAAMGGSAAALRSITKLQPIEGEGGKVFPSTYDKGKYATEKRRLASDDGTEREVECVLLNSVQSEANAAELALLHAIEREQIRLPLIEVDFSEANQQFQKDLPNLTSLEVPHRLADAILRDSMLPDGTRFSKSDYAARWGRSNLWNATAIYELCPTALVFGMWGSPEKPGGLGAKFERAYISEIVGVDALVVKERSGYRIDPISASKDVPLVRTGDGFQLAAEKAKNPVRPSELNHGNIPFDSTNGGVRCRFAERTTVVSLGALRKLRFPSDGKNDAKRDDAARTVLAAMGLCAGVLASERGTSLRSRCSLRPVAPRVWELLDGPGAAAKTYTVDSAAAIALLNEAVAAAKGAKLTWMEEKLTLKPTPELTALIRKSQEVMSAEDETEAS